VISFRSSSPAATPDSAPRVIAIALEHRAELASLELKEAGQHGLRTAIVISVSAVFALLGGMAATFALAAAVWDRPDRGMILSLAALGYLLASGAFALVASRRLKSWSPFSESARQLREDISCVQDIVSDATR